MALSRQVFRSLGAVVGGTVAVAALAISPAVDGSASAAAPTAGGCAAAARVDAQWGAGSAGGQVITVTVTNTSAAVSTKWTVSWTPGADQRITSSWNAEVNSSAGSVTATNTSYNGILAPGASTSFGVQLAGIAPAPAPSCDNGATAPPSSAPASSAPPGAADVTVTQADNQRTVTLVAGQTLSVSLPAEYLPPTAWGTGLAALSISGGYPSGQPLTATFRAVAPGSADVTTQSDHACLHAPTPCARPISLWTVHVDIVAS